MSKTNSNQNQRGDNRPLTVSPEKEIDYNKIQIKDFFGYDYTLRPHFMLYDVTDFIGRKMVLPGISLTAETEYGEEPFAVLTKSFGEFVCMKDCAYIDTNNCPFADEFIKLGIAEDTGFTKNSGFCIYPLWKFDENFLREIGGEEYEKYSEAFDKYMNCGEAMGDDEDISFEQSM